MADTLVSAHRADIIAEIEQRRFDLNLTLLKVYNGYRIIVGFALLVVYSQTLFSTRLGSLDERLFWWVTIIYTAFNIASLIFTWASTNRKYQLEALSLFFVVMDALLLAILMYCSGGISSGIAALMLITVATGAILVVGRSATLVAAIASMSVLYEEFYLALSAANVSADFFQAGVYGIIYFTTSLLIQRLSNRIRENDIRNLAQQAELADLERLNRLIIQRMRTGIIVVDGSDRVRMHNRSARFLLGAQSDQPFLALPPLLANALQQWRQDTTRRAAPFRVTHDSPEIRANFSAVREQQSDGDVTIFLEDTSEVQQQAQQLKLAELGRLSASIAHEVRNPLGAISHAAQLLNESDDLQPADQRLTDIIISHSNRMNGVVENVLEMSRRRQPRPERIRMLDALERFVAECRESFPEADIEVEVDPADTMIRVDQAHLTQALNNLIDNALRYSQENGRGLRARIEGGVQKATDRPYLNVIDYGKGVDAEQIPNLFQPFTSTAAGGTGLGLYITKELCDANQSQLSYSTHAEGGSCFRILFTHPNRITV